MSKQSILPCFLISFFLCLTLILSAEETTSFLPDSFDTLTGKLLTSLEAVKGSSVLAVLDIRNTDGRESALGHYLEERLADVLISDAGLAVVERNQIEQIFQEWEYSLSGMLKEDSMYEIGSMAGADAVLVGRLNRVDQAVQVNLRIIDTESALVLASVDGLITEPRYLSMYLDLFDTQVLTDEDFFIGRGRDFDRDQAFFGSFIELCHVIEKETGKLNFLDGSFLEFLEAAGSVDFTSGSRQNCTLKLRKDQFQPQHLYNFFFRDGRSRTVYYYDDNNYGWHTNPFFQELIEREYDTFGVPGIYREAVERSAAFSAAAVFPEASSVSPDKRKLQSWASASTPEWALLKALLDAAYMLETRMEMVTFRDNESMVDFVTEYIPLENLEWVYNNLIGKEVQESGDRYIVRISIDVSSF